MKFHPKDLPKGEAMAAELGRLARSHKQPFKAPQRWPEHLRQAWRRGYRGEGEQSSKTTTADTHAP